MLQIDPRPLRRAAALLLLTAPFGSIGFAQTPLVSGSNLTSNAKLGSAVAVLDDVTNDGISEFVGSAPEAGNIATPNRGTVTCFNGATGTVVWTFSGPFAGDKIGSSLANIGDVNGDGRDDLAVGAPFAATAGTPATAFGRVFVLDGVTGTQIVAVNGNEVGAQFGFSVAGAGNVNLSGTVDFLIGSPEDDTSAGGAGKVVLVTGNTGAPLLAKFGTSSSDRFGFSVANATDINGDGRNDLAMGAPDESNGSFGEGVVRIFSGLSGGVLRTIESNVSGARLGSALSQAADFNQNGNADMLMGMSGGQSAGSIDGIVRVYDLVDGSLDGFVTGFGQAGAGVGDPGTVSLAGDVDRDTFPDFLVGAPGFVSGAKHGRVTVYSGTNHGILESAFGNQSGARFGAAVSAAGIFDSTAVLGFVVGVPLHDVTVGVTTFVNVGRVTAFSAIPAGITLGTGATPSCLGPQDLIANSPSTIGNSAFRINLTKAPANLGLLLFSNSPLIAPTDYLAIGLPIRVDLLTATEVHTFDLLPSAPQTAAALLPLPNSAPIVGQTFHGQAITAWPPSTCVPSFFGLSASNTLSMTLLAP